MQKRFKLVKDYTCEYGTLEAGNQFDVVKGFIYYNGGLIEGHWSPFFEKLIREEMEKPNYLREVPIPYNKV